MLTCSNIWAASTTRPKVEGPHFQGQKCKCIFEETVQKCLAIKNSDTWTDSSSRNNIWSSFSSTDLNIECCFSCFNCQTIEDQFLTCFFIGKENPFFLFSNFIWDNKRSLFEFFFTGKESNHLWATDPYRDNRRSIFDFFPYWKRIKLSLSYRPI